MTRCHQTRCSFWSPHSNSNRLKIRIRKFTEANDEPWWRDLTKEKNNTTYHQRTTMGDNTNKRHSSTLGGRVKLFVEATPKLEQRQLEVFLAHSLRLLFGEFQSYGLSVSIEPCQSDRKNISSFSISCAMKDMPFVRSSLTLLTPPSYEDSQYRVDVIAIEQNNKTISWS